MERSIIQKFQQLQVLSNFDYQTMDELVQDLANALEESSHGNAGGKTRKRRGLKRRSKQSAIISPDFPCLSEDSESSFDEGFHLKEPLDSVQLSDSDDISCANYLSMGLLNYLKKQPSHMTGSFVESDSVNENFSPVRPHRRKRKFKRMAIDPLPCSMLASVDGEGDSNDRSLKLLKYCGHIKNLYQNFKIDPLSIHACGKRKRSMRERSVEVLGGEEASATNHDGQALAMKAQNLKQEDHVFLEPRQRRDEGDCNMMDCSEAGAVPMKHITESSSSSLSSSESDAGVYTNDEGREGDDEQSDFYFESGPACGVPGELPWWETEADDKTLEESMDPEFQAILNGSLQHMSWKTQQAFHSRISKLDIPKREIRAGRRRLRNQRPGFSIVTAFNEKISKFLQDPDQNELRLHPVKTKERNQLNFLASLYSLNMRNEGSNKTVYPVLTKTRNTTQVVNVASTLQVTANRVSLNDTKRRRKTQPSSPINDILCGENASPLGEGNKGNQMLRSMGWEPGMSLGSGNIGIRDPIQAVIRPKLQGLGYHANEKSS